MFLLKKWILLFFILFAVQLIHAQRSNGDCIYWSIEDFADGICDVEEIPYVDKVLRKKNSVEKYLIKTSYKNKKLRKAFAVRIDGELFFDQFEITRNLAKGDRLTSPGTDSYYIKAVSSGSYVYIEWSESGNNGPGVGVGGGGIGFGLGTSISLGKKKVTGLIYDHHQFEFNVFKNCKDFNDFLQERHPEFAYDCKKKKLPIERVREVISKLNNDKNRKSDSGDGEEVRYVTLFPHGSIVRNSCTLTIADEKIDFNDVSVIDIDLDCDGDNMICIEGTEVCLDVPCTSDVEFILISRDKETREYSIEPSNEKDFEYYKRLVERRKTRRKK